MVSALYQMLLNAVKSCVDEAVCLCEFLLVISFVQTGERWKRYVVQYDGLNVKETKLKFSRLYLQGRRRPNEGVETPIVGDTLPCLLELPRQIAVGQHHCGSVIKISEYFRSRTRAEE